MRKTLIRSGTESRGGDHRQCPEKETSHKGNWLRSPSPGVGEAAPSVLSKTKDNSAALGTNPVLQLQTFNAFKLAHVIGNQYGIN
jgi:hypothetical protein